MLWTTTMVRASHLDHVNDWIASFTGTREGRKKLNRTLARWFKVMIGTFPKGAKEREYALEISKALSAKAPPPPNSTVRVCHGHQQ
jgi:1,2-phenylacetyl-CoA epoxidase catalytic subunit